MKKTTMQSIANDLGISKMTVSRYFNGGYISDSTRLKIESHVKEHNYKPNFLAQNLKNESNIIGIVAPKIDNHVFNELVKGFITIADLYNIQLLYFSTNYDTIKEDNAIYSLNSMGVKGIIVDTNSISIKKKYFYDIDNLISFGLKSDFKNNVYFPDKIAINSLLPKNNNIAVCYVYKEYMLSTRTNIARDVLEQYEYKTQVIELSSLRYFDNNTLYICANDLIAYEVYRKIKQTDFSIGEDIYVAGIGANDINDLLFPSLTSVYFPYKDLAIRMMNMIITNRYESFCSDFDIIEGDSYPKKLYSKE